MNARLWLYWNCSKVKVTVRPNHPVRLYKRYRTDEGWSAEGVTLEHKGDFLQMNYLDEGRDCDGFVRTTREYRCSMSSLPVPQWRQVDETFEDMAAQVAGF